MLQNDIFLRHLNLLKTKQIEDSSAINKTFIEII